MNRNAEPSLHLGEGWGEGYVRVACVPAHPNPLPVGTRE
jgi:hypothetical protein